MEFIASFIGGFVGVFLAPYVLRIFTRPEKPTIMETNLTKHVFIEKEAKKSVYRDKEIEKEETSLFV